MPETIERYALVDVRDDKGGTTVLTWDVTDAPNEELADVLAIGIDAHLTVHGEERVNKVTVEARFLEMET